MKEIKIVNGKYYLGDIEYLEYNTKKSIKKNEYQRNYIIKRHLIKEPLGTLYARQYDTNAFVFYYLDEENNLKSVRKTISIH